MTFGKTVYKYFLKAFYRKTNKKEYKSLILKHNECHTNVITMQNGILIAKVLDGNIKKKNLLLTHPI